MRILKGLVRTLLLLPLTVMNAAGSLYSSLLRLARPDFGALWLEGQAVRNAESVKHVTHVSGGAKIDLKFYTPNPICRFRAETFSTKEPETLDWIDEYGGEGALFDIGANVGLYSIYYASKHSGAVYAFEPSVFNLGQLAKNIYANRVQHRVSIIPNPLTRASCFADFTLANTDEGGALSAFGVEYGHDGKPLKEKMAYRTLGMSLDFLFSSSVLNEYPRMMKIDVDGIEALILAGAMRTLSNPTCRTVLIEVDDGFTEQAEGVASVLTDCGFSLRHKLHSPMFNKGEFADIYNQIWVKPQG